jgi:hypothetical protein
VFLTFGTLGALLVAYRSGLIEVTQNFRPGVVAATGGIFPGDAGVVVPRDPAPLVEAAVSTPLSAAQLHEAGAQCDVVRHFRQVGRRHHDGTCARRPHGHEHVRRSRAWKRGVAFAAERGRQSGRHAAIPHRLRLQRVDTTPILELNAAITGE